jgi:hypothetical protein
VPVEAAAQTWDVNLQTARALMAKALAALVLTAPAAAQTGVDANPPPVSHHRWLRLKVNDGKPNGDVTMPFGSALCSSRKRFIAACRSTTDRNTPLQSPLGEDGEEALDRVKPGIRGRREVERPAWMRMNRSWQRQPPAVRRMISFVPMPSALSRTPLTPLHPFFNNMTIPTGFTMWLEMFFDLAA